MEALLYASQLPANAHQDRAACSSNFELTLDLAELDRYERDKARTTLLAKAQVEAVASLPSQWRGKAYQRREEPLNPAGREQAEERAALRCSASS